MSEGGEARNHEADEVALLERARWYVERWNLASADDDSRKLLMDMAALDAVRCAQGRDTDAPESDVERLANDLAGDWRERAERAEADVTMWKTRLVNETARLRELLRAARSPQGEDHEAALVAHAIEEALPFAVESRTAERVAEAVLSVLATNRNGEVDRLRAGISFVRGLCTDRASYSVIDERLGELLDGETNE